MVMELKSQAVAGVSANQEVLIETVYPSIAGSWIGQVIGNLCESIPLRIGGIPLSYFLFGPLVAPFAFLGYVQYKLSGEKYQLTNRSVQRRSALGGRLNQQIALQEIAEIAIDVLPGQEFYHAGNLLLLNAKGEEVMTLEGVVRPERFRQIILETREARVRSDDALATIDARAKA